MGKSKKVTRHVSIRLVEDVAVAVASMARAADWSEAKVVNHLARVGLAAGSGDDDRARRLVAEFKMAGFERQVHAEAAAKIRAARAGETHDPNQMTVDELLVDIGAAPAGGGGFEPSSVPPAALDGLTETAQTYGRGAVTPPADPPAIAAPPARVEVEAAAAAAAAAARTRKLARKAKPSSWTPKASRKSKGKR